MNAQAIQQYVIRYLEAQRCDILEKSPYHLTVKLSPEADKDLTNRSYYWGFVERTGVEPETMSFTFVFDQEKYDAAQAAKENQASLTNRPSTAASPADPSAPNGNGGQVNSILGTYFGIAPPPTARFGTRVPVEELTFGCRRLEQIFNSVKKHGQFVQQFEELPSKQRLSSPAAYSTWLCMNYKLEFLCDMKRDELHSLGIHLSTGEIKEKFHDSLTNTKLTPRLPASVHLQHNPISITKAVNLLEHHVEKMVKQYDHQWANDAQERLQEELDRIHSYYEKLIPSLIEEEKAEATQQYLLREQEIRWQYEPRIQVSVVNGGLFHLRPQ